MIAALVTSLTLISAAPVESAEPTPAPSGWSLTAGFTGVTAAGATLALAIVAEQLKAEGNLRAVSVAISAAALGALLPPLVFLGGWMGRRSANVRGSPALRVAGWIAYAGTLTASVVATAYGLQRKEPVNGLVALAGGMGGLSLALFSADSFVAWHQAREARRQQISLKQRTAWVPWMAPLATTNGGAGGMVGVSGWF